MAIRSISNSTESSSESRRLGEGGLRQARGLIAGRKDRPDLAVARVMSSGAREALSAAGIGWVDETGAAEIARGSLIV